MIFQISWSATREGNVPKPKKSVLQAFTIGFEHSLTVSTGVEDLKIHSFCTLFLLNYVCFHDFPDFVERYKGRKCPQAQKVSFTSVYDRFWVGVVMPKRGSNVSNTMKSLAKTCVQIHIPGLCSKNNMQESCTSCLLINTSVFDMDSVFGRMMVRGLSDGSWCRPLANG